jgi:segregation and condensation protein B
MNEPDQPKEPRAAAPAPPPPPEGTPPHPPDADPPQDQAAAPPDEPDAAPPAADAPETEGEASADDAVDAGAEASEAAASEPPDASTADAAGAGETPAAAETGEAAPAAAAEETAGTIEPDAAAPSGADKDLDLRRSRLVRAPAETEEPEESGPEPEGPEMVALRRTIEALLFAAEEPLTARELARAAGAKTLTVRKAIKLIREAYEAEPRPWELVEVGGGYRLATRPEFFPAVQKLKTQRAQRKLTQAALETLALIAYSKEPVGRAEIEAVRGVDSGPVLRQLLERRLVRIAGRGPGLGQPLLYAVSSDFLTHFGLNSTQDLPRPGEFKAP